LKLPFFPFSRSWLCHYCSGSYAQKSLEIP
jgi:hypothetical protein